MPFKDFQLVFAILVQSDFTYAEAGGGIEEIGYDFKNVFSQLDVLGLFRIQADPTVVRQAELGGSSRLVFRQLAEVIEESFG